MLRQCQSDAAWSDLFDNQEKLEMYSRSRQLLLKSSACCYLQKEWSLVFTSSQRHFQYFSVSSTLHPPVRQAGVLDSGDYTLRPTLLDANAPYRAFITRTQSDPPSYTPAMNVQNNGVKTILPYYQSLFTKFFSSCHCALEHWSSVARYLKVPDVPLPPTKPTSLGRSTSLEFVPDSVWASGDVHLNVLTRFAYNCRGLPLTPADRQAVDDLVRMGTPVFGVVEYPHHDHRDTVPNRCPDSPEAAAAAAAEYFAAMKKWDRAECRIWDILVNLIAMIVLSVKLHHAFCLLAKFVRLMCGLPAQAYKVPKFYYKYEFGEAIKIYVNEDDGPMASSSKADDDNWENEGDYDLNPTPHLDTKQEAEAKALFFKRGPGEEEGKWLQHEASPH
ncbi:hypothetical protein BS47DRAFT_1368243 [Hydnum rufescens UP504]|uniref:Uncharacterized protein n=1 Tax=Hydnum rufescens UP504 TaxID=1448309 RepID=A0A9P6DNH4_9AGAM|nr:hypothetical protein BS47DRAFT_1368243 [Hydnum rufescens UP504]